MNSIKLFSLGIIITPVVKVRRFFFKQNPLFRTIILSAITTFLIVGLSLYNNSPPASAASVTNIKTITNSLLYPITIRNGENSQEILTVGAGEGWNGDLWVPWVGSQSEMSKAIELTVAPDNTKIWIFQDYWNPPHQNAIKCVYHRQDYGAAHEIDGNNRGAGEKALIIYNDNYLQMR